MSRMQTTPVITVYKLADLFNAVTDQVAVYDEQLKGLSDWQQDHPPAATRNALHKIAAEIESWVKQGYDYAVTDRPFSDGNITGAVEDSMISQFGSVAIPQRNEPCRVNPVKADLLGQLRINI